MRLAALGHLAHHRHGGGAFHTGELFFGRFQLLRLGEGLGVVSGKIILEPFHLRRAAFFNRRTKNAMHVLWQRLLQLGQRAGDDGDDDLLVLEILDGHLGDIALGHVDSGLEFQETRISRVGHGHEGQQPRAVERVVDIHLEDLVGFLFPNHLAGGVQHLDTMHLEPLG